MTPLPTLLVVDDDPLVLPAIERFGRQLGYDVQYRAGGADALESLAGIRPDVALVDLHMPGVNGLEVLRAIRERDPECQVILMTGDPSVETAIAAVKAGARDYLGKPFDVSRLRNLLVDVREALARRERIMVADVDAATQLEFQGMIGRTPVMQQLFESIRRLAPHVRTVLITGETGTGKELVAAALHALGERRKKRFATVNCSAVVETLFESELFGHERGAFTGATDTRVGLFEHASGGTLFLDEAGELPLTLQPKLLRAVEYGEVQRVGSLQTRKADVCVIAATNRDLRTEAAAGRFRADLFYRLSVIEIHVPSLRDRREDIPYLTAAFIREFAGRLKKPITGVTPQAERLLQEAAWPGNVRELRNVIERACILTDARLLSERELLVATAAHVPEKPIERGADVRLLSTAQRDQIERALREARGNKAAAARLLGVSRRALYRWIERLDVRS